MRLFTLLLAAACVCASSPARAQPARGWKAPEPPQLRLRGAPPEQPGEPPESAQPSSDERDRYEVWVPSSYMKRTLARARRALEPLCRPRCGTVTLVRDDAMQPAGQNRDHAGDSSVIAYNPRGVLAWTMALGEAGGFFVVSHELGHHLDMLDPERRYGQRDPWPGELVAHVYAGCAMARAGFSRRALRALEERARQSITHPGMELDTVSYEHPPMVRVAAAVSAGYAQCSGGESLDTKRLLRRTRHAWNHSGLAAQRRAASAKPAGALAPPPRVRRARRHGPVRMCYRRGYGPK